MCDHLKLIVGIGSLVLLAWTTSTWAGSRILTWQHAGTGDAIASNFQVERKTEACAGTGPFAPLATVGAGVLTFTDATLEAGKVYCWQVKASNLAGVSDPSNAAENSGPFALPPAPSSLVTK